MMPSPILFVGTVCLIFIAIGAWSLWVGHRNRTLARASVAWPTVPGRIVECTVHHTVSHDRKRHAARHRYEPQICYQYAVGGEVFRGTVIRFGSLESGSERFARGFAGRYPVGKHVEVRYKPDEPSVAALETVSAGTGQIGVGIAIIVIALLVLVGVAIMQP